MKKPDRSEGDPASRRVARDRPPPAHHNLIGHHTMQQWQPAGAVGRHACPTLVPPSPEILVDSASVCTSDTPQGGPIAILRVPRMAPTTHLQGRQAMNRCGGWAARDSSAKFMAPAIPKLGSMARFDTLAGPARESGACGPCVLSSLRGSRDAQKFSRSIMIENVWNRKRRRVGAVGGQTISEKPANDESCSSLLANYE